MSTTTGGGGEKKKKVVQWLDDRTGLAAGISRRGASTVPWRPWLARLWPSMILMTFVVQLITGLVLWMYYSPSAQTAWESVYYVQHEVAGGWLVRGVHYYAAQVLVALVGLYVVQLVLFGAYRRPREFVFWVAVLLGLTSLGLCLTGDLLPWDQGRYTATQTRVSFLMLVPGIGSYLFKLAAGGPQFGHLTLSRFFALHVGVFAAAFLGLLILHSWCLHRAARAADTARRSDPYWPRQFVRNAVAGLVVMAVVLVLVCHRGLTGGHGGEPVSDYLGAELGPPADPDPAAADPAARPEWSFRALYELAHLFPGPWQLIPVFVIPTALLVYVLAMPLIGLIRVGHVLNVLVMVGLVGGAGYLSWRSYWTDYHDPDFRKAVRHGEAKAQRVVALARAAGIPAQGALALLRGDPKTRGPELFEQHCLVCHAYTAPKSGLAVPEGPSAPDLFRFASRDWLTRFLDPDQIQRPEFFGNTRFASGIMATYVRGPFAELPEEDLQAIIAALAAEAGSGPDPEGQDADLQQVTEGRALLVQHCSRCHPFGQHGSPGQAPDLTGYGSRGWLIGMIADPGHDRFYGPRNDRMPAYVESPQSPETNRLSPTDLLVLVRWMQGDWFEPGGKADAAARATDVPVLLALGGWEARRLPPPVPAESDPRGRALATFTMAQCHLCHAYTDPQGAGIPAHHPAAPNLFGFATEDWIRGLLDPDRVDGPEYFGTSPAFREGTMVDFVQSDLGDYVSDMGSDALLDLVDEAIDAGREAEFALEHLAELKAEIGEEELRQRVADAVEDEEFDEFVEDHAPDEWLEELGRQKLEALIAALATEARQELPGEVDEETEFLFEDFGCSECHKFHGVGDLGSAPDLTGYGSAAWLTEIITDPEQERFYPDTNDRMPAYHRFPDQPQKNLLSGEQIQRVVELIRGQLPRPVDAAP